MTDLPVIVGMNNPLTDREDAALLPYPVNCAGWRLWRMAHDVCGVSRAEWMRQTERQNLCNSRTWCPHEARARGETLWRTLEGRTVVLLGRAVLAALWLQPRPMLLWSVSSGVRWCSVPHPSGLCRDYNDPLVRLAVGLRMEELIS